MDNENNIESLFQDFSEPPRDYSPTPFLFLNHDMDPDITSDVLDELIRKGVKGVILHPRTGLSVKFASSEFWDKLREIVVRARDRGILVWLYDDYNWPSGTAAGMVISEKPDFTACGLGFRYSAKVKKWDEVIAAFRMKREGFKFLGKSPGVKMGRDWRGRVGREKYLLVTAERMTDTTFARTAAPWLFHPGGGALDIMNPDATDYFMEIVYGGFDENLKEFFGDPIMGIFTESPQNYRPFPWTQRFSEHFIRRFGYDIVEFLPSLITEIGDYRSIRWDYYTLIRDLSRESYYRKLRQWTESRGLKFTGHVGEEDFVEKLPQTHGSLFSPLNEMHIPGTDYQGGGHGYLKDELISGFPNFNPKVVSAISRGKGKGRVLCEMWGGSGWDVSPRKLKMSIDWGTALGINMFVPHGVHVSLMGLRKRDFPPSHYVQQPYWEDYKILTDYISRLSLMTSIGDKVVNILVLFPISTLWAETRGMGILSREGDELVKALKEITDNLLMNQLDFDYLFEEEIIEKLATISDETVIIGNNRYNTIIIPRTPHIYDYIFSFINRAKRAGIDVMILGPTPMVLKEEGLLPVETRITRFNSVRAIINNIKSRMNTALEIVGKNSAFFACQRRNYKGNDIHFLSYLGDETFSGSLKVNKYGNFEIWDPTTGRRYGIPDFELIDTGTLFQVRFEPGESLFLVVHQEETNTEKGRAFLPEKKAGEFFLPSKWEVIPSKDNMFRVSSWRLINTSKHQRYPGLGKLWRDSRYPIEAKIKMSIIRIFNEVTSLFSGRGRRIEYQSFINLETILRRSYSWARFLGLPLKGLGYYQKFDLIRDTALFLRLPMSVSTPPPGADYEIEANFHVDQLPERILIVWEDIGEPLEIFVNGNLVSDDPGEFFLWDRSNRRADVSGFLRSGKNRIGIKSRQPMFPTMAPVFHQIEPVVLSGNFDVKYNKITEKKDTSTKLSWGEEGTGNYSGTVTYRCRFRLPQRFKGRRAVLNLMDVRETIRVILNGEDVGTRLWPPYDFDLTDYLSNEENVLELMVSNTAANLLGNPVLSGIIGGTKLQFFLPRL